MRNKQFLRKATEEWTCRQDSSRGVSGCPWRTGATKTDHSTVAGMELAGVFSGGSRVLNIIVCVSRMARCTAGPPDVGNKVVLHIL